jgi:hypothetical protein
LLPQALRTGGTAFDEAFGCKIFEYFDSHQDDARDFDRAMTAKSRPDNVAVLRACDLSGARHIVDIGGGAGHLIQAILLRRPQAEGVLFDLPSVIESARVRKVARLAYHAGNFFKDDLPVADVYLMMQVLHDWSDEECVSILRNMRRAMPEESRLLVIEMLLNKSAEASSIKDRSVKMLDIEILALFGGRERTVSEFEALFGKAGLRLVQVTPTVTAMNILEVRRIASSQGDVVAA